MDSLLKDRADRGIQQVLLRVEREKLKTLEQREKKENLLRLSKQAVLAQIGERSGNPSVSPTANAVEKRAQDSCNRESGTGLPEENGDAEVHSLGVGRVVAQVETILLYSARVAYRQLLGPG